MQNCIFHILSALPARLVPYTQVPLLVHLSEKPLQLRTTLEPNLEICLRVLRDTNRKGNSLIIFQEYWNFFYVQRKWTETKTLRQENNVLFWCLIIMLLQLQILTSFTDSWTPSGWLFSRTSMSTEHKEASGLLSWTKRWKCLQMYIFYKLPKRLCVM